MPDMYDFLSSIVMSPEFRKTFKDLVKNPKTARQKIENYAIEAGYTLTENQVTQLLNLQISDEREEEFQSVNEFIKNQTGLDPQW